jgi:hypothetical protein
MMPKPLTVKLEVPSRSRPVAMRAWLSTLLNPHNMKVLEVTEEGDPDPIADFGWVCYNAGPGEFFWSEDRKSLEHELTDDLRPATQIEKHVFNLFGNNTEKLKDLL